MSGIVERPEGCTCPKGYPKHSNWANPPVHIVHAKRCALRTAQAEQ